ncbi:helix-turn-helix domain-containing protein [Fulvimarina endophytica]|nr:helix-turn-helix transcriptional regulator [Fulvimarina endophytica]
MKLQGQLMRQRKALGWSQQTLADLTGMSLATVKRWELGTSTPNAMDLFQWAAALGIEITSTVSESVTTDTAGAA